MQTTETRLFSSRGEFHQCVVELLARTRLTVAMADRDFSDWPLESPAVFEALSRILRTPDASVRLVVQQPEWLERYGARFGRLRRDFAGRIECRQPPPALRTRDGLMLGDRGHLLRRADVDAFRGRALFAVAEGLDPWRIRFESLWDESTPCLAPTSLGL